MLDSLDRPVIMGSVPEDESLPLPGNGIEEHMCVIGAEELVLGHVEHQDLRTSKLRRSTQEHRSKRRIIDAHRSLGRSGAPFVGILKATTSDDLD